MITFSHLGKLGRLGNQLFQYALLKSISIEKGYEIILDENLNNTEWHGQKCLLNNFELSCKYSNKLDVRNFHVERTPFTFCDEVLGQPDSTDFYGYFQSIHYFHKHREEIMKEFKLKDEILNKAKSILSKYQDKPVISIHFRRGDNVTIGCLSKSYLNANGDMDDTTDLGKYIKQAISNYNEDEVYFYVISGGSRDGSNTEDIEWCKRNFKGKNVIYSEGVEDIVEFAILTLCDGNIMSHSSSYGWWGAYLNKNQNVIAPRDYHLDITKEPGKTVWKAEDFFPNNWKLI
jgi:hypothetical protein